MKIVYEVKIFNNEWMRHTEEIKKEELEVALRCYNRMSERFSNTWRVVGVEE